MSKLLTVIIPTVLRDSVQVAIDSVNYPDIYTLVMGTKEPVDVITKHASVTTLRNQGAVIATTEWLTFLDDDDYWLPLHWPNLHMHLEQLSEDIHMIVTFPVDFPKFYDTVQLRKYIIHGEGLPASCITIRREAMAVLGGFPEDIVHSSHWALVAKALLVLGPEAVIINPEQTWIYTKNEKGLARQLATSPNINVTQDRREWLTQFVS